METWGQIGKNIHCQLCVCLSLYLPLPLWTSDYHSCHSFSLPSSSLLSFSRLVTSVFFFSPWLFLTAPPLSLLHLSLCILVKLSKQQPIGSLIYCLFTMKVISEAKARSKLDFLDLGTSDMLNQTIVCCGDCRVPYRISSIPYQSRPSPSVMTTKMSPGTVRCLLEGRIAPGWGCLLSTNLWMMCGPQNKVTRTECSDLCLREHGRWLFYIPRSPSMKRQPSAVCPFGSRLSYLARDHTPSTGSSWVM